METIKFDLTKKQGEIKPMNVVNNGPVFKRHSSDQKRSNIDPFTKAKIPYVRNHDAAFENGYHKTESILNEWNYVKGWEDEYIYSIETINGIKGAAFTMACMSEAQKSSIDMLMYYDARPCVFNGLFDFYTLRPQKGYYPFIWFSEFYGLEEIRSENAVENMYTLCGKRKDGKILAVITHYTDNDGADSKEIKLYFQKSGIYEIYLLDKDNDAALVNTTEDLIFNIVANTCLLIKEI